MSNYWSPEAIAARVAASQQQQVTPNQPIPGSVPYVAPVTQPNTGQVGSSVAGMQYNSNFGYDPSAWNKGREYWNNISNNPLNIAMANEEQKAKVKIEESKDELDEFDSGKPITYDNQGNLITQEDYDNQNKLDAENALATGGEEGLLGKYIAEQNPELYGKMTDDEGLFQGGVEGRSFGRLKDFFEGQGSFWDKMKERRDQRRMQKSGAAMQDDIGSAKLSKEDNRGGDGEGGDGGGSANWQAAGQAFGQMAQGHRKSYGKYGDIF